MELLAFALPSMCGAVATWLVSDGRTRAWIVLVTVWLSVPLGLAVSLGVGIWLKDLGNCHDPRGRDIVECIVFGLDATDWVNGLKMGGYTIALVALPWFVVGGVMLAIARIITVYRTDKP
jgi:hypothetical protein